jgi:hypothetical protein
MTILVPFHPSPISRGGGRLWRTQYRGNKRGKECLEFSDPSQRNKACDSGSFLPEICERCRQGRDYTRLRLELRITSLYCTLHPTPDFQRPLPSLHPLAITVCRTLSTHQLCTLDHDRGRNLQQSGSLEVGSTALSFGRFRRRHQLARQLLLKIGGNDVRPPDEHLVSPPLKMALSPLSNFFRRGLSGDLLAERQCVGKRGCRQHTETLKSCPDKGGTRRRRGHGGRWSQGEWPIAPRTVALVIYGPPVARHAQGRTSTRAGLDFGLAHLHQALHHGNLVACDPALCNPELCALCRSRAPVRSVCYRTHYEKRLALLHRGALFVVGAVTIPIVTLSWFQVVLENRNPGS